jgi:para-nitrobenzyl esterase
MIMAPAKPVADATARAPQADLPQGRYRGRLEHGIAVFRGIPYAAPPFGVRRFLPPQAVPPCSGRAEVVDAVDFAPASPQAPKDWAGNSVLVGGENCLCLNIWSGSSPGERRPVLVWMPGGGFMRGDAGDALYDGLAFAQKGVVFVSFNYRVGVDGFMHLPDAPDNRGLLDQLAALRWVREHIGAFGGDPDAITVGGSSAGAGALTCLLGLPESRGLFRRVILQSPSVSCQLPEEAATAAQAIGSLLGVPPSRQGLLDAPLPAVVRALARLAADYGLRQELGLSARNFFPLRPVIDGHLIKALPLPALASAWQAEGRPPLDLLVGANAAEMRFYLVPDGEIDRIGMDRVQAFVSACGAGPDIIAAYQATHPGASPGELLSAMQSDHFYREPARRIAAMACAAGLKARHYEFAWRSPLHGGRLGAAHAVELPFVFNTLGSPQGQALTGLTPPSGLAEKMNAAWVEFVLIGDVLGWPLACDASLRFDEVSCTTAMHQPGEAAGWQYGEAPAV